MFHIKFSLLLSYSPGTDSTALAASRKHGLRRKLASKATSPELASDLLEDVRETSLSATARQMQRLARLAYLPPRKSTADLMHNKSRCTNTTVSLEEAGRMDLESLQTLEAANRRFSQPVHREQTERSAQRISTPSLRLQPSRVYEGTPPYETPSALTGSDLNIHSIPSNMPSDPVDSYSLPSDDVGLFAQEKEVAEEVAWRSSLLLVVENQDLPSSNRVQDWLESSNDEIEESRPEVIMNQQQQQVQGFQARGVEAAVSEQVEKVVKSMSDVFGASSRIEEQEQESEQRELGGHSVDSWSEEDEGRDHTPGSSSMLDIPSQDVRSVQENLPENVEVAQDDEEEAWLDLGVADDGA